MTVWLLAADHGDAGGLSAEVRDGDRVLRPSDDGFKIGIVRRDPSPAIDWVDQLDRSRVPVEHFRALESSDRGPQRVDLPEVEAMVHGAGTSTPGEGGLPGHGGPKPPA